MHSPAFFSEKMARLIRDIWAKDGSVLTPETMTQETGEQKDINLSGILLRQYFPARC